jgi:transposase-like protein
VAAHAYLASPAAARSHGSLLADLSLALNSNRLAVVDGSTVEEACREYLVALRWPDGIECPRCESHRLSWIPTRSKWNCHACRYHFSVRSGTLLHDSHLPLWKWLVAVYLAVTSERGLTALELQGFLGGSYKSWWFAAHRMRSALEHARPTETRPTDVFDAIGSAVESRRPRVISRRGRRLRLSTTPRYMDYYWTEARWRLVNHENPSACHDVALALLEGTPVSQEGFVARTSR